MLTSAFDDKKCWQKYRQKISTKNVDKKLWQKMLTNNVDGSGHTTLKMSPKNLTNIKYLVLTRLYGRELHKNCSGACITCTRKLLVECIGSCAKMFGNSWLYYSHCTEEHFEHLKDSGMNSTDCFKGLWKNSKQCRYAYWKLPMDP